MNEHEETNRRTDSGMYKLTAGWASWRWLSGVSSKEKQWFLGTLRGRGGYQSWMAHMAKGLQNPEFLLRFERTSDPWERSKLVGQKISELRHSYRSMSEDQRAELAKQAEVELTTGLELMGKDKKTIQDLIALIDPPHNMTLQGRKHRKVLNSLFPIFFTGGKNGEETQKTHKGRTQQDRGHPSPLLLQTISSSDTS